MRVKRYNFLFVIGLMMTLVVSSAFAAGDEKDKKKVPKDMGVLAVKTTDTSYPVRVDGEYVGMSGVGTPAEFFFLPGIHKVEVAGPDGKIWTKDIEIVKARRNFVCLKVVQETITKPCPYRFTLSGPDKVTEGDLVTFAAINAGTAPIPLIYGWKVSNGKVTSGLGSPSITVDSTGLGGKTIDAEFDVNDGVYDNRCRQTISVPTAVIAIPPPVPPRV